MRIRIVTRHLGAVEWLKSKGIEGEVIQHLSLEDINKGDKIYGVLPIHIAKEALDRGAEVYMLILPNITHNARGRELTPEEMDKAGAKIVKIKNIELEEIEHKQD